MSVLYKPEERPPLGWNILYSLQWVAFNIVNVSVVPVIVGHALALDTGGIADLAQRTAFFAALASCLQVLFGHRLPVIEGPAGMWWGITITLAEMAPAMGKSLSVLCTDLELGVTVAGVILVILGLTGLLNRALGLFTPAVTGTVLVLLALQLAGPLTRGMLGVSAEHPSIDPAAAAVSVMVLAVVIFFNLRFPGFIGSIAILIGTLAGWLASYFIMGPSVPAMGNVAWLSLPELLAWGAPTYDPGIVLVCVLTGLLVISNLVASLIAMQRTLEMKTAKNTFDRGLTMTGVGDILAGMSATVGVVPYSASAGLVSLTGVGSRAPFLLFTVIMMVLGLMPPVSLVFSSIPAPVGNAVLLSSFCQMLGFGLRDFASLTFTGREYFVIGLPVIIGAGIFTLPPDVFQGVPAMLRYIVGNGFIAGMLLCILLEHVFLPMRR